MKYFVAIAFVLIIGSLVSALVFMLKGSSEKRDDTRSDAQLTEAERVERMARSKKMATALGLRVAFSVSLFLIILLLYALGYIEPTGIPVQRV
jgi:hypothetical protein